jgi:transcriptional regulatory protein RtcR
MATMAGDGLITVAIVEREQERLCRLWQQIGPRELGKAEPEEPDALLRQLLGDDGVGELDVFDRVQLGEVVRVCRASPSLSAAGRKLFQVSLKQRKGSNDADRLRKYLARYDLNFREIRASNES